jgi:UDP-2,3-diacylglucosamine hydrolase
MGDIFDFLAGEITYFVTQNQEIIQLINELSQKIDIVYLEGNHDYNLEKVFPNVTIITRDNQPLVCEFWDTSKLESNLKTRKIVLAHGDIFTPFSYNFYTSIIRNKSFLKFLNSIDIANWLTKKVDNWLRNKKLIYEFEDFETFAIKRLLHYKYQKADLILEGHYHQGKSYKHYTNLPAFGISAQFVMFKNNKLIELSVSDIDKNKLNLTNF